MNPNMTIVTAFFDVGRGDVPPVVRGRQVPAYQKRTFDEYFYYFNMLAAMKNDMVIYTEPRFVDTINKLRSNHGNVKNTRVVVYENGLESFDFITKLLENTLNSEEYVSKIDNPHLIEYWNAKYNLVNFLKSHFVAQAYENGFINTNKAAWIDFGYVRTPNSLPPSLVWDYDFDVNKIHLFNLKDIEPERPVEDIIKTGDVYIMGCHIVAGSHMWSRLKDLVFDNVAGLLERNLTDDDQTMLLLSYLQESNIFELHSVDPSNWFIIFNKFNKLREANV